MCKRSSAVWKESRPPLATRRPRGAVCDGTLVHLGAVLLPESLPAWEGLQTREKRWSLGGTPNPATFGSLFRNSLGRSSLSGSNSIANPVSHGLWIVEGAGAPFHPPFLPGGRTGCAALLPRSLDLQASRISQDGCALGREGQSLAGAQTSRRPFVGRDGEDLISPQRSQRRKTESQTGCTG